MAVPEPSALRTVPVLIQSDIVQHPLEKSFSTGKHPNSLAGGRENQINAELWYMQKFGHFWNYNEIVRFN